MMDALFKIADYDAFWSVCAMPIGLFICFFPMLLFVWLPMELKRPPGEKK